MQAQYQYVHYAAAPQQQVVSASAGGATYRVQQAPPQLQQQQQQHTVHIVQYPAEGGMAVRGPGTTPAHMQFVQTDHQGGVQRAYAYEQPTQVVYAAAPPQGARTMRVVQQQPQQQQLPGTPSATYAYRAAEPQHVTYHQAPSQHIQQQQLQQQQQAPPGYYMEEVVLMQVASPNGTVSQQQVVGVRTSPEQQPQYILHHESPAQQQQQQQQPQQQQQQQGAYYITQPAPVQHVVRQQPPGGSGGGQQGFYVVSTQNGQPVQAANEQPPPPAYAFARQPPQPQQQAQQPVYVETIVVQAPPSQQVLSIPSGAQYTIVQNPGNMHTVAHTAPPPPPYRAVAQGGMIGAAAPPPPSYGASIRGGYYGTAGRVAVSFPGSPAAPGSGYGRGGGPSSGNFGPGSSALGSAAARGTGDGDRKKHYQSNHPFDETDNFLACDNAPDNRTHYTPDMMPPIANFRPRPARLPPGPAKSTAPFILQNSPFPKPPRSFEAGNPGDSGMEADQSGSPRQTTEDVIRQTEMHLEVPRLVTETESDWHETRAVSHLTNESSFMSHRAAAGVVGPPGHDGHDTVVFSAGDSGLFGFDFSHFGSQPPRVFSDGFQ
jgi:hypothetical protein